MVANELTIYNAINVSFLATKYSCLVAIIETSFLYVEDRELFTHALCSSRKWYWKIFVAKTLNIRQEVNPSFCFAVLILSHRKTSKWPWPCLKSPYNALQTLGFCLRHVCLNSLSCSFDMQKAFIPDLHTSIWRPDICIWRLFSKSLQGPLWPSSTVKFSGWNTAQVEVQLHNEICLQKQS